MSARRLPSIAAVISKDFLQLGHLIWLEAMSVLLMRRKARQCWRWPPRSLRQASARPPAATRGAPSSEQGAHWADSSWPRGCPADREPAPVLPGSGCKANLLGE